MMDGRVDLVLDGGLCAGAGATTVDITEPYWRVIKAGAIDGEGNRRVPGIVVIQAFVRMKFLLILLGGGAGSLARYFAGSAISSRFGARFPIGTMVVNVTGCFLIGLIMTLLTERQPHPYWRLAAGGGVPRRLHHIFQFRVGDLLGGARGRLLDRPGQRRGQRRSWLRRGLAGRTAGATMNQCPPNGCGL